MDLLAELFSGEAQADPYPLYGRLHREHPVQRASVGTDGFWALARYADVIALLRDPRFSAAKFSSADLRVAREAGDAGVVHLLELTGGMLLVKDPPDHTRLRNLVNKAFTPRVVDGLRPRIQSLTDELLREPARARRLDVIADLAAPLPVIVIAELLGAPSEDRGLVKRWSDAFVVFADGTIRERGLAEAAQASLELCDYLRALIARRRSDPRDDLLSRLIAAREEDDALTEQELLGTAVLILAAGHETTTNLIGNGTLALLRSPGELARLRAEPELIRPAVEELLRYDSPVQVTSRIATEPVELHGEKIAAGEEVDVLIGAANRDPAQFPDPDRLDVARADNRHLAFGHGAHFCLGAALARAEGQIAIATLLRRLPELRLAGDPPQYRPGVVLRGLRSLQVEG